jgi:hypothetical protein
MKYCTQEERIAVWCILAFTLFIILALPPVATNIIEGIKFNAKKRFLLDGCKDCDEKERNFTIVGKDDDDKD